MRKYFSLLILTVFIFSFCLSLFSCGNRNESIPTDSDKEVTEGFSYTFSDSLGNSVTLTKKPEKVAVLFSSFADIWTLSGGELYITVGDSIERGFANEGTLLADEGAGHTSINTELIVSKMPDLVICTADYTVQAECASYLSSIGIPSAVFRVESVDDYLKVLKIFTDINGTDDIYATHGEKLNSDVSSLLAKIQEHTSGKEKKNILFIRAGSSPKSTKAKNSADNFACRMLEELSTYNIADSATVLLDGLSLEEILIKDPEYIFITTMGNEEAAREYVNSLFSEEGWSTLSAVKNGKVIFLEKDLFHYKPNAKWYSAYEFLCRTLYPELDTSK